LPVFLLEVPSLTHNESFLPALLLLPLLLLAILASVAAAVVSQLIKPIFVYRQASISSRSIVEGLAS